MRHSAYHLCHPCHQRFGFSLLTDERLAAAAGPARRIRPVANFARGKLRFAFRICDASFFRIAMRPFLILDSILGVTISFLPNE